MNLSPTLLVPIIIGLLTAIGTYLTVARRMSGRIRTTEAEKLWDESREIRRDYAERLRMSDDRQVTLEKRVAVLEDEKNQLFNENVTLRAQVRELEAAVVNNQSTIAELQATITLQHHELEELKHA